MSQKFHWLRKYILVLTYSLLDQWEIEKGHIFFVTFLELCDPAKDLLLYLICTIPRLSWCWAPSSAVASCALSARSTTWADASDQARVFEHFNRECLNIFNFSFLLVLILHFLQYKRIKTSTTWEDVSDQTRVFGHFQLWVLKHFHTKLFSFFTFYKIKEWKLLLHRETKRGCVYNL